MGIAIGLDLGTTSVSAVAVDDEGRVLKALSVKHGADVAGLPAGWVEQEPGRIRATACAALRELTRGLAGTPECLGLTGQMHGVVLLDDERRPVSRLITWQDRRALEPHPVSGETLLATLLARADDEAMRRTGCRLSAGYLGTTLYVLRETNTLPAGARQAALVVDWMASELTGEAIVTDRSNAASTGLYDLERDEWSREMLSAARVPGEMLPEVRESGVVIGRVTEGAARETGLPAGLAVCNAIGDNQAAILGSVPVGERVIQINVGTGGQISWVVDRFLRVEGMDTRYLPPGRFMLVGAGLAGGDAYAWVKRTAAAWLGVFDVALPEEELYRRMEQAIAASPVDAGGLVCEPFFRGTRRQPEARGVFRNVTPENFTPGNVARAVLRGIAEGMHSFLELAGEHAPKEARRIVATGNGVRRNPLLVEMLEERFGLPVEVPGHEEEAAYGAARLAQSSICASDAETDAGSSALRTFRERADAIRNQLDGRQHSSSAELLRDDRER